MSRPGGIEIPRDLADDQAVPQDLDSGALDPYTVPSTRRRRRAAWVYLIAAGVVVAGWGLGELPAGVLWLAGALSAVALWHVASAWRLGVSEGSALEAASRAVEFAVGHASAIVGFDGVRARPVWNVLVFSAEDPPARRALVRVDAVSGATLEWYEEALAAQPSGAAGAEGLAD